MFNAAGLIVPDPSIMLPPIPFIDDDAGRGAEYMVASMTKACGSPLLSHRRSRCARGPVWWIAARFKEQGDNCLMTNSGAGLSHAGSGRAQRKLRTPLPGHYFISTLPFQPAKVEWRRTGR